MHSWAGDTMDNTSDCRSEGLTPDWIVAFWGVGEFLVQGQCKSLKEGTKANNKIFTEFLVF